jgi:asparagine synthase (glutamine-hydrolysing)
MSNLLPEQITNRKDKMGFESPNNKWMSEAKDTMKKYFSGLQDDILNTKEIMKDFDKLFNQPESPENYRIFRLLSYAAWHKKFIEN